MGTNAEVMAWIMNQYSKYHGFSPAVVTGKPVELYGIPGREEATGRGVGILAVKLLGKLGRKPNQTRVAIQGFGNVGSHAGEVPARGRVQGRGRQRRQRRLLSPRRPRRARRAALRAGQPELAGRLHARPSRSPTRSCSSWTSSC